VRGIENRLSADFWRPALYFMNNENCERVRVRLKPHYDIIVGSGILKSVGAITRTALGETSRRIVLISNQKVVSLLGKPILAGLAENNFKTKVFLIGDGERHKSFRTLQRALSFLASLGLERSDAIVALGGGVVGDLAGLASALYLRGIALIQVPTTLLAQIDASVGGKTAVNLPQGKNLVGAFHQPRAVIIDTDTLRTLPKRELTSGWCEAIKQGAVGSRSLFGETRCVLEMNFSGLLKNSLSLWERAGVRASSERSGGVLSGSRSRSHLTRSQKGEGTSTTAWFL
jgi:3-dehydroquinate synthetase